MVARPKLLLADDSVTIRKVVELTFADEGIDVTTAADADTAMQKFVDVQPDIVLVDIGLPGTTGYQICEMIKQDDATRHIPVLLLVGSFEPFDQDAAERVGSDGFLTKPFHSIRDLVARVRDLLGPESIEAQAKPVSDTADIEDLYDISFANTAEMEEFDTVDDLLTDSGMDDELIEASSPSLNGSGPGSDEAGAANETTKEFDWSAESLVAEADSGVVSAESPPKTNFPFDSAEISSEPIVEIVAAETRGGDDIDTAEPEVESAAFAQTAESWSTELERISDDEEEPRDDPTTLESFDPISTTIEMDEVPNYELDSAGENAIAEAASDPVKTHSGFPDDQRSTVSEPSPELIALVAQRVIDKLSDQAVRDIAKEAVPRIAEKLIREALEQESKG